MKDKLKNPYKKTSQKNWFKRLLFLQQAGYWVL